MPFVLELLAYMWSKFLLEKVVEMPFVLEYC